MLFFIYTVQEKTGQNFFCNISYRSRCDSDEIWYTISWIILLQNETGHAHRTLATISLLQKVTPEFIPSHLNGGHKICQIWIQ